MSMMLMVRAMRIKVGNPLRKLVLIKLADNANDLGECWPSHQHIAEQCEISRRSVINHIKALEEMGLLRREYRTKNNEKQSNLYYLTLDKKTEFGGSAGDSLPSAGDSQGSAGAAPPSAGDAQGGSAGDAHRTSHSFEPVNEPVNESLEKEEKANAKKFDPKEALKELGVGDDLIEDFLKVRKTKKAPLTKTALQGFIREAKKADVPLSHAIRFTIERNWQGFNAGWYRNAMGGFNNQASPKPNSTQISQDFGGGGIRMGRGARQVFQNQGEGEQQ